MFNKFIMHLNWKLVLIDTLYVAVFAMLYSVVLGLVIAMPYLTFGVDYQETDPENFEKFLFDKNEDGELTFSYPYEIFLFSIYFIVYSYLFCRIIKKKRENVIFHTLIVAFIILIYPVVFIPFWGWDAVSFLKGSLVVILSVIIALSYYWYFLRNEVKG